MKQKLFWVSLSILLVGLLVISFPIFAVNSPWTYLGSQDYQLTASVDGTSVLYNALQDADKEKIRNAVGGTMTPEGLEIVSGSPSDSSNWRGQRPDIIDPVHFKKLAGSGLSESDAAVFDVNYEDVDGNKTVKIAKMTVNGKKVLTAADPEFANFKLTASPDSRRYVIPSEKGLWSVNPESGASVKISKDQFNGKSYDELAKAHRELFSAVDGPAVLWWNENPLFSPDSNFMVYMTNRDCLETLGNSIWVYDFSTGEERPLVQNTNGEQYVSIGWLDHSHLLYKQSVQDTARYFVSDLEGNHVLLNLEGADPVVLAVQCSGLIAYTSDYSASRDINIGKVDTNTGIISKQYEKSIDGALRDPYAFSPDGTQFAYLYAPDSENTTQSIAIIDLTGNTEKAVNELPAAAKTRHMISSFDWFGNSKLLVRLNKVTKGLHETSTWIYDMEGGSKHE